MAEKRQRRELRERRDKVSRLFGLGMRVNKISQLVGSKPSTIKSDIAFITKELCHQQDPGLLLSEIMTNLKSTKRLIYQVFQEAPMGSKARVDSLKLMADLDLRMMQTVVPERYQIEHIGASLGQLIGSEDTSQLPQWQQAKIEAEREKLATDHEAKNRLEAIDILAGMEDPSPYQRSYFEAVARGEQPPAFSESFEEGPTEEERKEEEKAKKLREIDAVAEAWAKDDNQSKR